jgi:inward rectifier potassium channel
MHVIDETSPLHGLGPSEFVETDVRVLLSIRGRDRETGSDVHDVHPYAASQVLFGVAYRDVVTFDSEGRAHADLRRLSDVEPTGSPRPPDAAPAPPARAT